MTNKWINGIEVNKDTRTVIFPDKYEVFIDDKSIVYSNLIQCYLKTSSLDAIQISPKLAACLVNELRIEIFL